MVVNAPPEVNHFVKASEHRQALEDGSPLTALCGHQWVPSGKPLSPKTCTECLVVYIAITGAGCKVPRWA